MADDDVDLVLVDRDLVDTLDRLESLVEVVHRVRGLAAPRVGQVSATAVVVEVLDIGHSFVQVERPTILTPLAGARTCCNLDEDGGNWLLDPDESAELARDPPERAIHQHRLETGKTFEHDGMPLSASLA